MRVYVAHQVKWVEIERERDAVCRVCSMQHECGGGDSLETVSTLLLMSAVMWMRPLRSVWSVPQRLGTLATQRLWMFIMQSAHREREEAP